MTERHKSKATESYARPLRHHDCPTQLLPHRHDHGFIFYVLTTGFLGHLQEKQKGRGAFIGNGVSALIRLFLTLQMTTQV